MAINRAGLRERHDTVPHGSRRSVHLVGVHEVAAHVEVGRQVQHQVLQRRVVQQVPVRQRRLTARAELPAL